MSDPTFVRERQTRLERWLMKAPKYVYRGWLGEPFRWRHIMKLTTTGRRSGKPRTTLVSYLPLHGRYVVFSGWGTRSLWYRNLLADPSVTIQVGRHTFGAIAYPILDRARRRELMLAMSAFSTQCGPPLLLRPLTCHLYDYDASIRLAVAHADEVPTVELVPVTEGREIRHG